MNKDDLIKSLTMLFNDMAFAQQAANDLMATEDPKELEEFATLIKRAKGHVLAHTKGHEKHIETLRELIRELKSIKSDLDTDAFLIKMAKRLK